MFVCLLSGKCFEGLLRLCDSKFSDLIELQIMVFDRVGQNGIATWKAGVGEL
jgi:hypothetical protein